jgi:hypothetical protein
MTIIHILVREVILRLYAEIFEGKTKIRWMLSLRIHLELRPLEDFIKIADLMISIKDGGLIGQEEVI